jgi:hypothetical protein
LVQAGTVLQSLDHGNHRMLRHGAEVMFV